MFETCLPKTALQETGPRGLLLLGSLGTHLTFVLTFDHVALTELQQGG